MRDHNAFDTMDAKSLAHMRRSRASTSINSASPMHKESLHKTLLRGRIRGAVWLSIALTAFVAGCSTSSTDLVHLPDGQSGFAVNCSGSGSGSSWAECYQRAGNACGASGYDVVSKDNDDGATAGGGVANIATANVKSRSMVIRCK